MSVSQQHIGSVLVAGLGKSGLATCHYLFAHSELTASVTVVDSSAQPARADELAALSAGVSYTSMFGVEEVPQSAHFDLAIVSPGLMPSSALYRSIERVSERVISEIEFAFEQHPQNWIAITGTNGKTTTTSLVTHILKEAGRNAVSVGNIGAPAIEAVGEASGDTIFVAEVSSFQLHAIDAFRPRVAAVLNITPDHINWHGSFEAYAEDKARVFARSGAGDTILLNGDDAASAPYIKRAQETEAQTWVISLEDNELGRWTTPDRLHIKGPHNVSNALFAAHAARAFDVDDAQITHALETFEPVEHRLQYVDTVDGVLWYNDSKATNPDAVFKALSAFETQGVILLVGGRNKGNRFVDLARAAFSKPNFKYALCFGEAGHDIFDDFSSVEAELSGVENAQQKTRRFETMDDAMNAARVLATVGDCVVLSPACASFDEFNSFEHRGEVFMDTVRSFAQEI